MKQKMHDGSDQTPDKVDATGDGVLQDKASKVKQLLSATEVKGDPRRRGEIIVSGSIHDTTITLFIDGEMWAEIDYAPHKKMWCIQDCCGECLTHIEHMHAEVPNEGSRRDATKAIEKAKEMIRDGSMPSPEEARAAFDKREAEASDDD
jgi:hypothetical protein